MDLVDTKETLVRDLVVLLSRLMSCRLKLRFYFLIHFFFDTIFNGFWNTPDDFLSHECTIHYHRDTVPILNDYKPDYKDVRRFWLRCVLLGDSDFNREIISNIFRTVLNKDGFRIFCQFMERQGYDFTEMNTPDLVEQLIRTEPNWRNAI